MIRIVSCLLLALLMVSSCQAMTPINEVSLRQAQEYGQEGARQTLQDFLRPWTVYEEKAPRLDASAERAWVYSSWLLVAADTREKAIARHSTDLASAEAVLADYAGFLPVNVELHSRDPKLFTGISAVLKQNGKAFAADQIIPPAAESSEAPTAGPCYIYFKLEGLMTDRPAQLIVTGGDGKIRRFFVDFNKIK